MLLDFYKYEGAGNDFILLDDRTGNFPLRNHDLIRRLCDRRFGIGADGLILLQSVPACDFNMVYYNADGKESTMCGNGGRCIAAFARKLGIISRQTRFMAADGEHIAEIKTGNLIRLRMSDVSDIESDHDYYYLNTGSPHYVVFAERVKNLDVFREGRMIRNSARFNAEGTNVNFVEDFGEYLLVRTYERGVENETMACGTGVVAAVICSYLKRKSDSLTYVMPVKVPGGHLAVSLVRKDNAFTDIWLEGPATYVFSGQIELK